VSFKVKNPNLTSPVQTIGLDIDYTDTFTYVTPPSSFYSDLPGIGLPVFTYDEDPPHDMIEGSFYLAGSGTGFEIPANPTGTTEYTIGFKVKTRPASVGSVDENNVPRLTVDGVAIPIPFYSGFTFYTMSEDVCQEAIFTYAFGENEINSAPPVTITGANPICKGGTTQLSRTAGGLWSSSDAAIATVSATGLVTTIDSGYVYFIFADDTTGCSANTPLLRVNSPKLSSGASEICQGTTTPLTPATSGWISKSPTIASVSPTTGVVTGVSAGTAVMVFTDGVTTCVDSLEITVKSCMPTIVPDIRLDICASPARSILLSSFIDTIPGTDILWEKVTVSAPGFTNVVKGGINSVDFVSNGTYTYRYTFSIASVNQASAIAYVHVLKPNNKYHNIDTIVVCRFKDNNKTINLNTILGLELGGTWSYLEDSNNVASTNVTTPPIASRHYGAKIFDAVKAWTDAIPYPSYLINYHGLDPTAKKFKFQYTPHAASCIGTTPKTFVIIVTDIF
jgi:hypothetical protein